MDVFIPNPDGIRDLLSDPPAVKHLQAAAEAAVEVALSGHPERETSFAHYRESVFVGEPVETDGVVSVPYGSSSGLWHIVEFGSARSVPYRPLSKGAEAIGRFVETGD